jgi:hypothetical protein
MDPCLGLPNVQHFCPHISHGLDPSVLLHELLKCWVIFLDLCWSNLYGLYGLLGPCIFLGCPSLEVPQQGSRWWFIVFRLSMIGWLGDGSNFVAGWRAPWSWRGSLTVSGRLNRLNTSG